ncbi:hypothetical protein TSOC_009910 [Tetrabaena socialis]|uniref:Uncharacterized protein n=1 Tax=Tetrabaena socialis TaxID=47790 RepID=A0A2J7ZUR8_9CHLO|nr:hypothetical protein TSOC_009910 [Tetrabaena socialis]|eukprot:PNH03980.1 hypothetical protein TSOC_009910 [Tetrabaena socialis]
MRAPAQRVQRAASLILFLRSSASLTQPSLSSPHSYTPSQMPDLAQRGDVSCFGSFHRRYIVSFGACSAAGDGARAVGEGGRGSFGSCQWVAGGVVLSLLAAVPLLLVASMAAARSPPPALPLRTVDMCRRCPSPTSIVDASCSASACAGCMATTSHTYVSIATTPTTSGV